MTNHTVQLASLYEADFCAWLQQQSQMLKEGRLADLDLENLLEELEALVRSEKRAFESNLRVLLQHLLKWHYQLDRRSNSWRATIREHQLRLRKQLEDSPSLKPYFYKVFAETYQDARELAALETGLPMDAFPIEAPYRVDQVLNESWVEGDREATLE
ncbi:MAG: DUF29 domain-containing protein [Leptolyngbyaceae bacterium]|nr:DUF29 domain-containing protein [Leptolyngbyaceae bacterium]